MDDRMHHEIDAVTGDVVVTPWTQRDRDQHTQLTLLHDRHLVEVAIREAAHAAVLEKVAAAADVSVDDLHAALGLRQGYGSKDEAAH